MWSIASPSKFDPNGYVFSYPANALSTYLPAFIASAKRGGPQAAESLRLARACADWTLKYRFPNEGVVPLFPYTTIKMGKTGQSVEGKNTTPMRAAAAAPGFVRLFEVTGQTAYLEYARHIADTLIKLQRPDGSFPFRINPKTGAVADAYATDSIDLALLVDALEPHGFDRTRRLAAQRTIDWLLAYACATNHWQGAYEDVYSTPRFYNLTQRHAVSLVRYLCRHRDENTYLPSRGPKAQPLDRRPVRDLRPPEQVVETADQDAVSLRTDSLLGSWRRSHGLLDPGTDRLAPRHGRGRVPGKGESRGQRHLRPAVFQRRVSTWGARHYEKERLVPDEDPGNNWYNCNARADWGLYSLDDYVRSLKKWAVVRITRLFLTVTTHGRRRLTKSAIILVSKEIAEHGLRHPGKNGDCRGRVLSTKRIDSNHNRFHPQRVSWRIDPPFGCLGRRMILACDFHKPRPTTPVRSTTVNSRFIRIFAIAAAAGEWTPRRVITQGPRRPCLGRGTQPRR